MVKKKLEQIIYVSWEESESGWGTRPDGCSLHLTKEKYDAFLKKYWARMPKSTPCEYSRPAGEPCVAFASEKLYNKVKKSGNGMFCYQDEERKLVKNKELKYGSQRSGWVPVRS
jgi:hypothetical protein